MIFRNSITSPNHSSTLRAGLLVSFSILATLGCGSRSDLSAEPAIPCEGDGGLSPDAGALAGDAGARNDAGAPSDASSSDAGCSPALLANLEQQLITAATSPPGPPFYLFEATADYLAFFRMEAVGSDGAAALCAPGEISSSESCAYDPTRTADGPNDVHHSNGLNQFVGPDGRSWAWAYFGGLAFSSRNVWVFGNLERTPQTYATILDYTACLVAIDAR